MRPEWAENVNEELTKQINANFLEVVEYPEWLANIVPVAKKDGRVRVYVDYRDLNKASPKDDFPLPHIDVLVDSAARSAMYLFMDGFSGYSQILMNEDDKAKTAFITEWGIYCYCIMLFGLKNASETYQCVVTTLLHDMIRKEVEVYVDDMLVKSGTSEDHIDVLDKFLTRIKEYNLRLNPKNVFFVLHLGNFWVISSDREKLRWIQTR